MGHTQDSYAGLRLNKFPEDLRTYEHLMWTSRSNVVIELGTYEGGSTLWLRDRLDAFRKYGRIGRPRVIAVDIQADWTESLIRGVDRSATGIKFLQADVTDPTLPGRVARLLRPEDRVLVIEDTAHIYDTTRAALSGFADLVSPGSFFVVEDTCVDDEELRVDAAWPRGVRAAINDWLDSEGRGRFEVATDLELYGVTCHPGGFLRRIGPVGPVGPET